MKRVLAVLAHPDDETFICGGSLAKAAADGSRVTLVCATRGEMGRRLGVPPTATRESLARLREAELRAACAALGVDALHFLGLRDKTLEIQPPDELENTVLAHMEEIRPEEVVTFHERFGGHPDHCTIGAATARAFASYRRQMPGAALLAVAWRHMADRPGDFGLTRQQVLAVDVSAQLGEKLRAFRAHRTQTGMNRRMWQSDAEGRRALEDTEYFIRLEGRA